MPQTKPRGRRASVTRRRRVYGHESPRVFTPPRRVLTPATSAGFAAIAFAVWLHEQLAGTDLEDLVPVLSPWERWFLIHALELNPDGSYRFKIVLLWVARQNGKTFVALIILLFRMFMDREAQMIGVAQKLSTAKKVWDDAQLVIDAIPRLKRERGKTNNINGELWFELTGRQRYWVDSADNGGRGLTFDLVFIDEIVKHKTFKAWAALSKTINARRRSQLLAASNTGDLDSVVQRHLHKMAIAGLDDPETTIGLFWWTPPPGLPLNELETLAWSNPSLGYSMEPAGLLTSWASDPAPVFLAEVANIFPDASIGGPFQPGRWEACLDRLGARMPGSPVYVCVEVSHDRTWATIGFAALREDGRAHLGVMASRPGTDWVVPWLTAPERTFTPAAITFQTRGAPVSSLLGEFVQAKLAVTEWGGADLGRATGLILDGVNLGKITHRVQPVLDVAAQTAVMKKLGDGWVIDRAASPGDAAPLSAVTGAYWLLRNPPKTRTPGVRIVRSRREQDS